VQSPLLEQVSPGPKVPGVQDVLVVPLLELPELLDPQDSAIVPVVMVPH
jgi:hypothetical protein